jgi:allantoinase
LSPEGRDLVGYGNRRLDFSWKGGSRLAVSVVVNFEEGSEHSHPVDGMVEGIGEFLPIDVPARDVGNESSYEYGSRVGVWRILDALKEARAKGTFFATALQMNPGAARAIVGQGHEVCDHGLRWTEHYRYSYAEEERMIKKSVELIRRVTGKTPVGFYAREPSVNTLKIVGRQKNFIYDSDDYSDDLPHRHGKKGILLLPYSPDANDFHFQSPMHRFANSPEFFTYLKDTFDVLHDESLRQPKMMSVGLHSRVTGRPGRIPALKNFLRYVRRFSDVWVATREEIARYWIDEVEPNL